MKFYLLTASDFHNNNKPKPKPIIYKNKNNNNIKKLKTIINNYNEDNFLYKEIPYFVYKNVYYQWRTDEFLKNVSKILLNRLKSGFAKFNKTLLFIGSLEKQYFDECFKNVKYEYKERKGRKTNINRYYYTFNNETGFPNFGNYLENTEIKNNTVIYSKYSSITFILTNKDDRIYLKYNQYSYYLNGDLVIICN